MFFNAKPCEDLCVQTGLSLLSVETNHRGPQMLGFFGEMELCLNVLILMEVFMFVMNKKAGI